MGYIQLPNEKIVRADENGFITVQVDVELSDLIDNDLEGVLTLLSDLATGSETLSNISYNVIDHCGDTLTLKVTGDINMIDVEDVDLESLSLKEFEVQVTRVGYGARTVRLSARTDEEAIDIAGDDAGNHSYSEHHSDYLVAASVV